MSNKAAFETLNVTLKDIRNNNNAIGCITMVLDGDIRQTLRVIPRGTGADEMQACLKSSYLWEGIQRLGLTTNMRLNINGDPSAQKFADNLIQQGNGSITPDNQDGCIS
ncbi:hypothetical protein AVEN_165029-1 [Araneus ventricosus]|uniref:ATP-dependent DNA helicase n=1 Tax=Araneus ventricosus TaxID=182803 RepID=A0A4Y2GJ19_ARAVE|nr:hypothetical protein AVEN_165029-1 [Araneus ventricosus]